MTHVAPGAPSTKKIKTCVEPRAPTPTKPVDFHARVVKSKPGRRGCCRKILPKPGPPKGTERPFRTIPEVLIAHENCPALPCLGEETAYRSIIRPSPFEKMRRCVSERCREPAEPPRAAPGHLTFSPFWMTSCRKMTYVQYVCRRAWCEVK